MRRILIGLLAILCAVPASAQDGRIERIRDKLNRPDDDTPAKKDSDKKADDNSDEDGDSLFGEVAFLALLTPFAVPHAALHDDFQRSAYFPNYPYSKDRPGYLTFEDAEKPEAHLRMFSFQLTLEYGNDFHNVERFGNRLVFDTTSRFGVEANTDYYRERESCGCYDSLNFSAVNLTYRFAQSTHVQMHAGLGVNILDDGWGTHYGVNFLYGADVFPMKPFVASLLLEGGNVQDLGVFRARGTVGVNYGHFEGFVGYDYLNIGGVDLQGALIGLRLWF